jgi:hypothetical protein
VNGPWPALVKAALLGTERTGRPSPDAGAGMAGLLVDLVKLTPAGFQAVAEEDPDSALRLLAEANEHVAPIVERNEVSKPTSVVGSRQRLRQARNGLDPDELLGRQADD